MREAWGTVQGLNVRRGIHSKTGLRISEILSYTLEYVRLEL